jgi:hypothetical protein
MPSVPKLDIVVMKNTRLSEVFASDILNWEHHLWICNQELLITRPQRQSDPQTEGF